MGPGMFDGLDTFIKIALVAIPVALVLGLYQAWKIAVWLWSLNWSAL